jgi:hypothetical protein
MTAGVKFVRRRGEKRGVERVGGWTNVKFSFTFDVLNPPCALFKTSRFGQNSCVLKTYVKKVVRFQLSPGLRIFSVCITKLGPERPEVLNRFTLYICRQSSARLEKSISKPLLAVVKSKACSGLQDRSGSAAVRGRPGGPLGAGGVPLYKHVKLLDV